MALEEEELLLKQLPHSVEAEQAVLGSMLIDPRCVPDVIEQLRPEDFYICLLYTSPSPRDLG